MKRERILQLAEMAMILSDCCSEITINVQISSEYGGGLMASIFIHDLRSRSDCKVYCADGRKSEVFEELEYIEDENLEAAEARIDELIKEVWNGDTV